MLGNQHLKTFTEYNKQIIVAEFYAIKKIPSSNIH